MRLTWIFSSLIIFIFGVLLIKTLWWLLIGIIIGFPIILLSLILFLLGLILPNQERIINIQNYFSNMSNNNQKNNNKNKNNNTNNNYYKNKIKKAKIIKEKTINKKK